GFRRIKGHRDLPKLAAAIRRELSLPQPNKATTEEAATVHAACQSHPDRHRRSTPSGTTSTPATLDDVVRRGRQLANIE
ncbi:MAG: hypothetical protein ACR2OB_03060, partial [Solirubrobacteraceae bacterium]